MGAPQLATTEGPLPPGGCGLPMRRKEDAREARYGAARIGMRIRSWENTVPLTHAQGVGRNAACGWQAEHAAFCEDTVLYSAPHSMIERLAGRAYSFAPLHRRAGPAQRLGHVYCGVISATTVLLRACAPIHTRQTFAVGGA